MTDTASKPRRLNDLDALRGFAMLLGIALHAALSFLPGFWAVQDSRASFDGLYDELLHAIHGFRMPLFGRLSKVHSRLLVILRHPPAVRVLNAFPVVFFPLGARSQSTLTTSKYG